MLAYRQIVRDNLRAIEVSLESTGELCYLQAIDRTLTMAAVAVLLVVVPGDVQSSRQAVDTTRQRSESDMSG